MGIFSAIGSAVKAVGGWIGRNIGAVAPAAAQTAGKLADGVWQSEIARRGRKMDLRLLRDQREWAMQDAAKNRKVARNWRNNERGFQQRWRANERRYAEGYREDERGFAKEWRDAERAYSERIAARNLRQAKAITTEQRQYDRGTLSRLRDDAMAAGFNPLTALGETKGAIGSATMVNPAFSAAYAQDGPISSPLGMGAPGGAGAPMNSEWQPVALPAMASPAFVGEALSSGVETFFNREQLARDEEAHALQNALMREELTAIQRENSLPPTTFGYSIPQVVSSGPTTSGRTAELSGPAFVLPSQLPPEADPVTTAPFLSRQEVTPGNTFWVPEADDLDEFIMKGAFIGSQQMWRSGQRAFTGPDRAARSQRIGEDWQRFGEPGVVPVWRP